MKVAGGGAELAARSNVPAKRVFAAYDGYKWIENAKSCPQGLQVN
jgi:hypothetical protein